MPLKFSIFFCEPSPYILMYLCIYVFAFMCFYVCIMYFVPICAQCTVDAYLFYFIELICHVIYLSIQSRLLCVFCVQKVYAVLKLFCIEIYLRPQQNQENDTKGILLLPRLPHKICLNNENQETGTGNQEPERTWMNATPFAARVRLFGHNIQSLL